MKASEYRQRIAVAGTSEKLHEVTLPSGFVWKLRTPPVQQFLLSGRLPKDLASKLVALDPIKDKKKRLEAIEKSLSATELTQSLEFGRDLLLHCAVEPRIVANPDPDNDNEIAPEEIDPADFDFLLGWVMTGGSPGKILGNFRTK